MNQIPEVKNGTLLAANSSEPNPEGLASYEIFGRPGSNERKKNWGHIDLVNKFLHPHAYYEFMRLQRNIKELIDGTSEFYLDVASGKLIKIDQNHPCPKAVHHGTGVPFLYKVWNQLKWECPDNTAPATAMRMKFFKSLKRDEAFISKIPVIPAFYRDVHADASQVSEINTMYRKFITNASSLRATSGMLELFGVSSSDKKIQNTLFELYDYFITILGGSKGFIHRNVMGKVTDYAARSVISMTQYNKDSIKDIEVDYMHSALPLSTCCKCFAPFIRYGIRKIVDRFIHGNNFIWYRDPKTGKVERKELAVDYMDDFNSDNIDKLIELYESSFDHRLDLFTVRCKDGSIVPLFRIWDEETEYDKLMTDDSNEDTNKEENLGRLHKHPATLTEVLYMAAYETVKDKIIYITRYPIEDQHNIYPSLFNIIPTINYKGRYVHGYYYPKFPVLPKDISDQEKLNYIFIDSLRVFPSYLKALGGDFDGDQCSVQGVFTDEANEAGRKYITSNMNIMNVSGGSMREFSEVARLGIFQLTYRFTND